MSVVTGNTRKKAASSGEAMKDGSYPIRDGADLKRAISAFGRAKDKGAAKRHIIRRAKALGKTDELPDSWRELALQEPKFLTRETIEDAMVAAACEPITFGTLKRPEPDLVDVELEAKASRHNIDAEPDRLVSSAKLKTVFKRGLRDYTARPCVTPEQYAHARVNSFLRLLASGAPDSASYSSDNDLLPVSHPLAPPPFSDKVRRILSGS